MISIFYYVPVYLILGAVGMAMANRKAGPVIRRQRWVKYFSYIGITGTVIASIFLHFFNFLAVLIVLAGFMELGMVNFKTQRSFSVESFLVYGLIAVGFVLFSFFLKQEALLFIYFQVFIFDAFGQITGQLLGKKSLVPKISPAKTIEGLIGSMVFCIISALLASGWVHISAVEAVLFGLITGCTSFCGDLMASWWKRRQQIKDYSNWLPGQGGFLDRFDSFIFTGCIYYLISIFFSNFI